MDRKAIKTLILSLLFMSASLPLSAAENTSAYSRLADVPNASCRVVYDEALPADAKEVWDSVGAIRYICPGYGDYNMHFVAGDALVALGFAPEGQDDAVLLPESFSVLSNANWQIVEWRLRDGEPFATIQRWFLDHGGLPPRFEENGSVLVVSKLNPNRAPVSCMIGFVDAKANANANQLARRVADQQTDAFECGTNAPAFFGETGPTVAEHRIMY